MSSNQAQSGFDDIGLEVLSTAVAEPSLLALAMSGTVTLLLARKRKAGVCRPA